MIIWLFHRKAIRRAKEICEGRDWRLHYMEAVNELIAKYC